MLALGFGLGRRWWIDGICPKLTRHPCLLSVEDCGSAVDFDLRGACVGIGAPADYGAVKFCGAGMS